MSTDTNAQKEARQAIAKRIRDYAEGIYVDGYSGERQAERDNSIKEHFAALADVIEEEYFA